MSESYIIPRLPLEYDLETKAILKQVIKAKSKLSELKGLLLKRYHHIINVLHIFREKHKDDLASIYVKKLFIIVNIIDKY